MSRLKDGLPCHRVDISARGNTDTAHLRSKGIREIIPVEVQSGNHVKLIRPCQYLLQKCICNGILYQYLTGRNLPLAVIPADHLIRKLLLG